MGGEDNAGDAKRNTPDSTLHMQYGSSASAQMILSGPELYSYSTSKSRVLEH